MDLRPLGPDAHEHLAAFRCSTGADYSLEVEEEIRNHLAGWLADGVVEAVGSWVGDELVSVITFTRNPYLWKVRHLATDLRHRRRKQAFRLKVHVGEMAAGAGAAALLSLVHRDNVAMRRLNEKLLGAEDEREGAYLWCTVPLPLAL